MTIIIKPIHIADIVRPLTSSDLSFDMTQIKLIHVQVISAQKAIQELYLEQVVCPAVETLAVNHSHVIKTGVTRGGEFFKYGLTRDGLLADWLRFLVRTVTRFLF